MTIPLVSILVTLIIIGLVFWGIRTVAGVFKIPEQITTIIYVLLVIIVVLWLLSLIGVGPGITLR